MIPTSLSCRITWKCLSHFVVCSETLNTDGPAADNNDTTQESDEQSDDNEDESYPALGDALTQLGLPEYVGLFESEEMDMETFVSWSTNRYLWDSQTRQGETKQISEMDYERPA